MKDKMIYVLIVLVLLVGGWTSAARRPVATTFEYKQSCNFKDLNKLGAEGWELIAVTDNGKAMCFFYKRKLS